MNGSDQRQVHLDFARGLAALLVVFHHARHLIFSNYNPQLGLAEKLLYSLCGLGHQAVAIFFVLSGYFVAGSVARDFKTGRWSWRSYLIRRGSRLYCVLAPALVLTLGLDWLGRTLAQEPNNYYDAVSLPRSHSIATFFGNLFFLQTIAVPVYGTNSPLWSLANEFWYYLLFPLACAALFPRGAFFSQARAGAILMLAAAVIFLPPDLLGLGLVWLMGYAVYLLLGSRFAPFFNRVSIFLIALLAIFFFRSFSSNRSYDTSDYLVGASFALMMPFLILRQPTHSWYRALAIGLSEISYTLYLVHFPLSVFFLTCLGVTCPATPSLATYALFFADIGVSLLGAILMWSLFESRTNLLRKWLERQLPPPHSIPR